MPPFFALSASFTRRFRRLVQPVLALVHPAFCELAGLVLCIVPIPTLSIGHGFGGIPAPCDFGSSAFPFPPQKTSGTTEKFFCAPPEMQTLALGAVPTRFSVPQLQGQKMEKQSHVREQSPAYRVSWQE